MSRHSEFFKAAVRLGWTRWLSQLDEPLSIVDTEKRNSNRDSWEPIVQELGQQVASVVHLDRSRIRLGVASDLTISTESVISALQGLHPWRKGPYEVFGVHIDTEWRSDWKWDRVSPHISSLRGRRVLDVGCGSGYHCWRMSSAGADFVLGIDPSQLFWMQFQLFKSWMPSRRVFYLPVPLEQFPKQTKAFDTVFSMGVLYHRKSPFDHLMELRGCLRKGGELILETLVVEGDEHTILVPNERYAMMNNVFFLPSVPALLNWVKRFGFRNPRCVDVNRTSIDEQRSTEWMRFNSLPDFLDPSDHQKTVEGHPSPLRATIIAER